MLKDMDLGISYDINDFQDVAQKLMPKLRELCEKYNITILFTHHLNKRNETFLELDLMFYSGPVIDQNRTLC